MGALLGIVAASFVVPPMLSWYNEAGYLSKGGQPAAMVNLPEVVRYATTRLIRGQAIGGAIGAASSSSRPGAGGRRRRRAAPRGRAHRSLAGRPASARPVVVRGARDLRDRLLAGRERAIGSRIRTAIARSPAVAGSVTIPTSLVQMVAVADLAAGAGAVRDGSLRRAARRGGAPAPVAAFSMRSSSRERLSGEAAAPPGVAQEQDERVGRRGVARDPRGSGRTPRGASPRARRRRRPRASSRTRWRVAAASLPNVSKASSASDRSTRMSREPGLLELRRDHLGTADEPQEHVGGGVVAVDDHRFEQLGDRERDPAVRCAVGDRAVSRAHVGGGERDALIQAKRARSTRRSIS